MLNSHKFLIGNSKYNKYALLAEKFVYITKNVS